MRALSLHHPEISRESLLLMAEEIPGAWTGIRISGLLLMHSGWTCPQVADLFGLSRWSVVKWNRKANKEGLSAVYDKHRPGRPSQFNKETLKRLDRALLKSPKDFGIARTRWDGRVVAEYLDRFHHVKIHVRHAQRLIRKLGYSLRQPIYRFAQASDEGVEEFRSTIKKNRLDSKRNK